MSVWQKFQSALNDKTFAALSCFATAYSAFISVALLTHRPVLLVCGLAISASITGTYWMNAWPATERTVQFGHAAGGYAIALTPMLWGPNWKHLLIGLGLVALWTFPKEYVFDVLVEKASIADGWTDQSHYLMGAGIAGALAFAFVMR